MSEKKKPGPQRIYEPCMTYLVPERKEQIKQDAIALETTPSGLIRGIVDKHYEEKANA